MLLETLFLDEQTAQTYSEGIEYSPPKDAVDGAMFTLYFKDGSYPLSGKMAEEKGRDTHMILDRDEGQKAEVASDADSLDAEKHSDNGSLNTCDQTNSTSARSMNVDIKKGQLTKRMPHSSESSSWNNYQLSGSESSSVKASHPISVKDIFLHSLISSELSNQKLAWLAIRIIDKSSPILAEEWDIFSQEDQSVLISYMENIYGTRLTSKHNKDALDQLNGIMVKSPKNKRNEEKLKKIAKKVNSMMTQTFVSLNNLHHQTGDELEEIVFGAYFGQVAMEGSTTNIFSSNHAFSQKAFSKIVSKQRYAEDFETVLNTSYIPEFIKIRQEKVLKSIAYIRKRLFADQEQQESTITNDLIKRAPWALSEVLEGVKLCQSLINRSKLY